MFDVVWIFMTPLKIQMLKPKVMVLGGGAIERWLGHKGGALVNGISALREIAHSLCDVKVQ